MDCTEQIDPGNAILVSTKKGCWGCVLLAVGS